MSPAHLLSLSRVVAGAPIAALILAGHGNALLWAALIFAASAITDLLDGPIARRSTISPFGVYLDTTGDKVLVSVVLVAMASAGLVDAWMAMVIIGREFLVTGVRTLASIDGLVISANFAGKVKTTVTLVAIVVVLLVASARQGGLLHGVGDLSAWRDLGWAAMFLAVVLTVYSGGKYILDARSLFTSPHPARQEPPVPATKDARV